MLAIEQLSDGSIQRTRIEPDGTTSVEAVPRLQSSLSIGHAGTALSVGPSPRAADQVDFLSELFTPH